MCVCVAVFVCSGQCHILNGDIYYQIRTSETSSQTKTHKRRHLTLNYLLQ